MCKKNDAKTRKNRPFEATKPTKSEPYTGVFQAQSGTLGQPKLNFGTAKHICLVRSKLNFGVVRLDKQHFRTQ